MLWGSKVTTTTDFPPISAESIINDADLFLTWVSSFALCSLLINSTIRAKVFKWSFESRTLELSVSVGLHKWTKWSRNSLNGNEVAAVKEILHLATILKNERTNCYVSGSIPSRSKFCPVRAPANREKLFSWSGLCMKDTDWFWNNGLECRKEQECAVTVFVSERPLVLQRTEPRRRGQT